VTDRECTGCGLRSCDGRCFNESDPEVVEFWENLNKLLAMRDADGSVGDPLLRKDAA
jgi:hypothetical protein